jgi:hypothetical protein
MSVAARPLLARTATSTSLNAWKTAVSYDNRDVLDATLGPDGRRRRLYVEQVVNLEGAEVVRRIFQLCADGMGVRNIAVRLNDEGVLAPQPRRIGRPRSGPRRPCVRSCTGPATAAS